MQDKQYSPRTLALLGRGPAEPVTETPVAPEEEWSPRVRALVDTTKKTAGDAWEELKADPWKLAPYKSAVSDTLKYASLHDISTRMESGEATEEEGRVMAEWLEDAQRNTSLGYDVVSILAEMPAFIGEFLTGGAIATKAGSVAGRKLMGKAVREAVEKAATKKAERSLVRRAVDGSVLSAGQLAANEAIGQVLGGSRVQAGAWRRTLPGMELTENESGQVGIVMQGTTGDFMDALPDAILSEYIELISERSGSALMDGAKRIPPVAYLHAMQKEVFSHFRERAPGPLVDALTKLGKAGGWDGPIEEYLEERFGGALKGATGAEEGGILANAWPDLQSQAAELIAFSVPAAGRAGLVAAAGPGANAAVPKQGFATVGRPGQAAEEVTPEAREELIRGFEEEVGVPIEEVEMPEADGATGATSDKDNTDGGEGGTPEQPTEREPLSPEQERVEVYRKAFEGSGIEIIPVRSKDGEPLKKRQGASPRPGVVLWDVNSKQHPAEVLTHELRHNLERTHPGVSEWLDTVLEKHGPQVQEFAGWYNERLEAAGLPALEDAETLGKEGRAVKAESLAPWVWLSLTPEGGQAVANLIKNGGRTGLQQLRDLASDALKLVGVEVRKTQEKRLEKAQQSLMAQGFGSAEWVWSPEAAEMGMALAEALGVAAGLPPTAATGQVRSGGDDDKGPRKRLPWEAEFQADMERGEPAEAQEAATPASAAPGARPAPEAVRAEAVPRTSTQPLVQPLQAAARQQTRYMGNKREFLFKNAKRLAAAILGGPSAVKVIFDFYAGGGTYGLSVATSGAAAEVEEVVINEIDPERRARLERAGREGGSFMEAWETDPVLRQLAAELEPLTRGKSSSPAALALDVAAGERESKKHERFARYVEQVRGLSARSKTAVLAVRDVMFSQRVSTWEKILRTAKEDGDRIKAQFDAAKAKGIKVTVVGVDAVSPEAVALTQGGRRGLVLLDPPYHETTAGTYSAGGKDYAFAGADFLQLNAEVGAQMLPGNTVIYHNKGTQGVKDALRDAFGGNMTVSTWNRGAKKQPEVLGVIHGRSRSGAARDERGRDVGQPAGRPAEAGAERDVLGRVRRERTRRAGGGSQADDGRAQRPDRREREAESALTGAQTKRLRQRSNRLRARADLARQAGEETRAVQLERKAAKVPVARKRRDDTESAEERALREWDEGTLYSVPIVDQLGFYSTVESALHSVEQKRFLPAQVIPRLIKGGAKQEELDWMGLEPWLAAKPKGEKIDREELLEFIQNSRLIINELVSGDQPISAARVAQDRWGAINALVDHMMNNSQDVTHDEPEGWTWDWNGETAQQYFEDEEDAEDDLRDYMLNFYGGLSDAQLATQLEVDGVDLPDSGVDERLVAMREALYEEFKSDVPGSISYTMGKGYELDLAWMPEPIFYETQEEAIRAGEDKTLAWANAQSEDTILELLPDQADVPTGPNRRVRYGDETLSLAGGSNYREILLQLPDEDTKPARPSMDDLQRMAWGATENHEDSATIAIPTEALADGGIRIKHPLPSKEDQRLLLHRVQNWFDGRPYGVIATEEVHDAVLKLAEDLYGGSSSYEDKAAWLEWFATEVSIWNDGDFGVHKPRFRGGHWSEEDIVAHARVSDRLTADGKRALYIDEIQSDWHQSGRDRGYRLMPGPALDRMKQAERSTWSAYEAAQAARDEVKWKVENDTLNEAEEAILGEKLKALTVKAKAAGKKASDAHSDLVQAETSGVPDAPFKTSWPTMVMRRMIRMAAEGGHDELSWSTGVIQIARYQGATRRVVDKITWDTSYVNKPYRLEEGGASSFQDEAGRSGLRDFDVMVNGERVMTVEATSAMMAHRITKEMLAKSSSGVSQEGMVTVVGMKDGLVTWHERFDVEGKQMDDPSKTIADYLGREMAEKIAAAEDGMVKGDDIAVGGKGMRAFYDKRLVDTAKKLGKKFGSAVRSKEIGAGPESAPDSLQRDIRGFERDRRVALERVKDLKRLPLTHPTRPAMFNAPIEEYAPGVVERRKAAHQEKIEQAEMEAKLAGEEIERLEAELKEYENGEIERFKAVHSMPITEEMKASVLEKGQPLFSVPPAQRHMELRGFDMGGEGLVDALRRRFQDKDLRVRRLEEALRAAGGVLSPDDSLYLAMDRFSGKTTSRLRKWKKRYLDRLAKLMSDGDITDEQLAEYLYALHAKERDEHLLEKFPERFEDAEVGGSGMPAQMRRQILDRVRKRKGYEQYKQAAELVRAMTAETRDTMVEGGLISEKTRAAWDAQYQHYVPLRTLFEGAGYGTGSGMNVSGAEAKEAKGRGTLAHSPLTWALLDAQKAIIRSEKNRVGQSFLALIKEHADLLKSFRVRDEGATEEDTNGELLPSEPRAAEDEFSLKVKGRQHYIRVTDPRLLASLRNLGQESTPAALRAAGSVMRMIASLNTSLDPGFMLSNFFRDLQTAGINLSGEESGAMAARVMKDAIFGQPGRAVWRGLRGKARENEWDDWFKEMEENGGTVGFWTMPDFEGQVRAIQREARRLGNSPLQQAERVLMQAKDWVEHANQAVENNVRLAAYAAARDNGATPIEAANLSKNLTVNFNRRGEDQLFNALYMFYNASVQGTMRLLSAMKHPGVQRTAAGIVAATFMLDLWNRANGGDDEDGVPFYDKIPEWVKSRNLIIMDPSGSGDRIQIPLPYGYNIFHGIGQQAASVMVGGKSKVDAAEDLLAVAWESFYPLGSEATLLQTVTPTLLDPIAQVGENKTFTGAPVMPTAYGDPPPPDSSRYWGSVGAQWKHLATWMNEITGGDAVTPGKVDVSPETLEHAFEFLTGGPGRQANRIKRLFDANQEGRETKLFDWPLVRRLVGEHDDRFDRERYYQQRSRVRRAVDRLDDARERRDGQRVKELRVSDRPLLTLAPVLKKTEARLRQLRSRKKALDDPAAGRKIDTEIDRLQMAFAKRYRKLTGAM